MERKIRWRDKYSEDFEEQLVVQATKWTFLAYVNEHLTSNIREGFHSTALYLKKILDTIFLM